MNHIALPDAAVLEAALLEPAGLSIADTEKWLGRLMTPGVDFADLYFQRQRQESWVMEEGILKEAGHQLAQGVGVRAVSGEKTGFAYSDEIERATLDEAVRAASSISRQGQNGTLATSRPTTASALYAADDPISALEADDKVALLRHADTQARAADTRVNQVSVSMAFSHEQVLVMASDGTLGADIRPLVRFNISVLVEQDGRRERGYVGWGGRFSASHFDRDTITEKAHEAVRQALVNLDAIEAPAGQLPVVLAPGWPGVLLHEAVGHGLEGDFNRKGSSTFSGRVGEKVASELCTIVDDGTLAQRRGSLSIDDEGTPTAHNVLIEKGILKGYMQDKLNARLMGVAATGNGRRESYAHLPMPRMTNTFMLPGEHEQADMIRSIKRGLFAVNFGGGQVDITSGKFVFSASEAYMIEDGKITAPVKGATLIGNGPDVMQQVSMVGNDLALDEGVGVCGKDGQSVPVGVGQPSLKIDALTIGGTQA